MLISFIFQHICDILQTIMKIAARDNNISNELNLNIPISICFQVTTKCDLKCKFCISNSKPDHETKDLPTDKVIQIIDLLGQAGLPRLDFSGGEPTQRHDIGELIKRSLYWKIYTVITTNLIKLNGKTDDLLNANTVKVSIDGNQNLHDQIRGAGTFASSVENIKKLIDKGGQVQINSVIFKATLCHIDFLLDLSQEMQINRHQFIFLIPDGQAKDMAPDNYLTDKEKSKVIKKIDKYVKKTRRDVLIYDYLDFPRSQVVIDPKGNMLVQSNRELIVIGNVLSDPLDQMFLSGYDRFAHFRRYLEKYRIKGLKDENREKGT